MIARHIRVFQITESLSVQYGGLAAACARLSDHLAGIGADVTLASVDGDQPGRRVPVSAEVKTVRMSPWPPRWLRYAPGLGDAMTASSPAVVHAHGLWRLYLAQAAWFAGNRSVPLVISTHGMLHGPARDQRGALKKVVRRLGQDDILASAQCLHATANEEADEIRSLGFRTPIAVIPWGVDLPAAPARRATPAGGLVVFLGRFHPTKGLEALIRSWARVSSRFPAARLVLAGYDDGGFSGQFKALAESLGVGASVSFEGPVEGEQREELFARASVLALPSPSENFGFVVPEALVRGLPVITTQGTPWSSLVAERCGWWVPATEEALAGALTEALDSPPAVLQQMGERGRQFARDMFDWDRVAKAMLDLYAWTLGQVPEPSFILRS